MRIIIITGVLSICGVLFLATVDLKPYLQGEETGEEDLAIGVQDSSFAKGNITQEVIEPAVLSEHIEVVTEDDPEETSVAVAPTEDVPLQSVEIVELVVNEDVQPKGSFGKPLTEVVLVKSEKILAGDKSKDPINSPAGMKANSVDFKIITLSKQEYPYSILLDTYLDLNVAQIAISEYRKQGIESFWVKVDLGEKGVKYRLFSSFFSTIEEGQKYLQKQKMVNKLVKPTVYSSSVGVFNDKQQLAIAYHKVQQCDVVPYVLANDDGDYFLYIGAFYTKVGAEIQCEDLADKNISCMAVKRSTTIQ